MQNAIPSENGRQFGTVLPLLSELGPSRLADLWYAELVFTRERAARRGKYA